MGVIEEVVRCSQAHMKDLGERGERGESVCFGKTCLPCAMGFVLKLLDFVLSPHI